MPGGCDQNRAEGEAASGPGSGEQIQLLAQEEFQTALLGAQLEAELQLGTMRNCRRLRGLISRGNS